MRRPFLRAAIRVTYYPSLWFSRLMSVLGRWNWWDAVDEHVIVGAVPSTADLQRLRDLGVGAVVNLCDEFRGHEAELARLNIAQLCLPTLDYFHPSESDLRQGLAFINEQIRLGRK